VAPAGGAVPGTLGLKRPPRSTPDTWAGAISETLYGGGIELVVARANAIGSFIVPRECRQKAPGLQTHDAARHRPGLVVDLVLHERRHDLVVVLGVAGRAFDSAGGLLLNARDLGRYVALHPSAWPPRDDPDAGPVRRSSVREMANRSISSNLTARRVDGKLQVVDTGTAMVCSSEQTAVLNASCPTLAACRG